MLLENFHRRQKIAHFDHECIPERWCTPVAPPRTGDSALSRRLQAAPRDRVVAGRHYSLTDGRMRALHALQSDFVAFDRQLDTSVISAFDAALEVCEILDETMSRRV